MVLKQVAETDVEIYASNQKKLVDKIVAEATAAPILMGHMTTPARMEDVPCAVPCHHLGFVVEKVSV